LPFNELSGYWIATIHVVRPMTSLLPLFMNWLRNFYVSLADDLIDQDGS
jgi:hypothetical protein